jgi:hypothetical protein
MLGPEIRRAGIVAAHSIIAAKLPVVHTCHFKPATVDGTRVTKCIECAGLPEPGAA